MAAETKYPSTETNHLPTLTYTIHHSLRYVVVALQLVTSSDDSRPLRRIDVALDVILRSVSAAQYTVTSIAHLAIYT